MVLVLQVVLLLVSFFFYLPEQVFAAPVLAPGPAAVRAGFAEPYGSFLK